MTERILYIEIRAHWDPNDPEDARALGHEIGTAVKACPHIDAVNRIVDKQISEDRLISEFLGELIDKMKQKGH